MKGRKEKAKMREERICRRILIANRLESRRRDERGEKDGKRERERIFCKTGSRMKQRKIEEDAYTYCAKEE